MTLEPRVIGRYALYGEIAAGGMATVHYGRLLGPVGFSRTVAIKRLHAQYAKDPEFVAMFLDEARLAARIRHPNVVPTLDVVALEGELFLIMDYVQGESLAKLSRRRPVPPKIVAAVMCGALHGLHAAHEARNERGEPLDIVHRDVSPQNILVGADGVARVLDFGVAKASGRMQTTKDGQIKGKVAYMAPEQLRGSVTRQTDVYAAAIVIWEALTGERLFAGGDEFETLAKALSGKVRPPSSLVPDLPAGLDDIVLKGLALEPAQRWATAREMALELERCCGFASPSEVGAWVDRTASEVLSKRSAILQDIEARTASGPSDGMRHDAMPERAKRVEAAVASKAASEDEKTQTEAGGATAVESDDAFFTGSDVRAPELEPSPRVARRLVVAVIGLFGVAAALVAVRALWSARSTPAAPSSSTSVVASTATSADTGARQATVALSVAPALSMAPSSASSSSPGPAPSASPARANAPMAHGRGAAPSTPAPAAAAAAAKKACDPPYTLDSAGHKHYKIECL